MGGRGKRNKTQTPVEDCGGNQCGGCKACCDDLRDIIAGLREGAAGSKATIIKLREENKKLRENEVVMKEHETALKGKIGDLTIERDELNVNLRSTNLKKKKNGSGRWLIRHMSGVDRPAQEVVSTVVKEVLFPNMKDMPAGWEEYDEDPDTICGLLMSMIEPPDGKSKEDYWLETVREAVNYKFGQLKRQASNKLKKVVCCE